MEKMYCFACGFKMLDDATILRKEKFPMCDCCGFHYGIDDHEYDVFVSKRAEWIEEGMPFGVSLSPNDISWTLEVVIQQLNNLKKCDFLVLRNVTENYYKFILDDNKNWTPDFDEEKVNANWAKYRPIV